MYMYSMYAHVHVHMQVDHSCRKSWDTYVQKLETVDVDEETGSEVVHWVMDFPVSALSTGYITCINAHVYMCMCMCSE